MFKTFLQSLLQRPRAIAGAGIAVMLVGLSAPADAYLFHPEDRKNVPLEKLCWSWIRQAGTESRDDRAKWIEDMAQTAKACALFYDKSRSAWAAHSWGVSYLIINDSGKAEFHKAGILSEVNAITQAHHANDPYTVEAACGMLRSFHREGDARCKPGEEERAAAEAEADIAQITRDRDRLERDNDNALQAFEAMRMMNESRP